MTGTTLDPYTTLGIPTRASHDEAARAHRRLAKEFHPDVNSGPAAAERMRRINEAWQILSNPARRARYDAERRPASWPGPSYQTGYDPRTSSTTWTAWPESRRSPEPRNRRPAGPGPVAPAFGDRPAVLVAVTAVLALMYFIGLWLGNAP